MPARLTARERQLRSIPEKDFQSSVEGLLRLHRWRFYHAPANLPRTGRDGKKWVQNIRAGFPDLVAIRPPRLIFAELKKEDGTVDPDQVQWLGDLEQMGLVSPVEVYLWRPSQISDIARILA